MIPNWIIFASLAGLASNAFNFFNRFHLKENEDSTAYSWFFETFRMTVFLFLVPFDFYLHLDLYTLILLLLVGLTEFAAVYFYMKMHSISELSISTILSRGRLIWVPIIAFLLFRENLSSLDYLGIVILFIGLSIAASPKKFFVDKGAFYANIAAFVVAINLVIMKLLTPLSSVSVLMVLCSLPSVILFPYFMKNPKMRILVEFRRNLPIKIVANFIHVLSAYFLVLALKIGEVSKVTAIYQGMMIVAVLAGIIFLKESEDIFKKLLGATVTIVGVILLT